MRRITAIAAAAMLGVTAPAAARVAPGSFDAHLGARLERSWTWAATTACGPETGQGRRVVTIHTAAPARVGTTGGTIRVLGTLELRGVARTWEAVDGSCVERVQLCPRIRSAIVGSVRLVMRGDTVRLSNLRYRVAGRTGCAPEVAAVRAALGDEPRIDRVAVRDRERKLRNPRIARVRVRGSYTPSTQLGGNVAGTVRASVTWSLVLDRR